MKISIALATYNGTRFLVEQLESFLAQTRPPDEIVISDDCSTDSTFELLKTFRNRCSIPVVLMPGDRNEGHLRNFERALSRCTGDLVFLSDQDDWWDADKIEVVVNVATQHPDADLFINDAYYANESLERQNATVLSRVEAVGTSSDGHIAGACTAVTQRFLRFLLPFPPRDCPQHDVYIHRWANLLYNKIVIRKPLQLWRIHSNSATAGNEMHSPVTASVLSRYAQARGVDSALACEAKAVEFSMMRDVLSERCGELRVMPTAPAAEGLEAAIAAVISANIARARVAKTGRALRLPLIAAMLVRGQYRHFKGWKSLAKDLVR